MDIVLRATVMFAFVFVLLRLLGKRELSQMTPFEFVVLVVLGDFIQQGVTHNDFSLTGAALAVGTFAFWSLLLSWAAFLSPHAERLLEGAPLVVVRDGRILNENLVADRLTPREIESAMRLQGIASVGDVAWAILEPQGKISFIEKKPA
jgi:uncharacterized membrane protein YcaP (DUF421 family)